MNYFINDTQARLEIMPNDNNGSVKFVIVEHESDLTTLVEVEFNDVEAIKEMLSTFTYHYEQALKEANKE